MREPPDEVMHSAAAEGIRTPTVTLPFLDRIQASFGRHPIGHIKAHIGPGAAEAAWAMNALAFASSEHVVFGGPPDLRTAAHEAAHVVQQQAGVQLTGGIGREGDAYERHADAVADVVVAGRSAERLLGQFTAAPNGTFSFDEVARLVPVRQGCVKPITWLNNGVSVNDAEGLRQEAEVPGTRARVAADTAFGGQPSKTQPALEREMDRIGVAIASVGDRVVPDSRQISADACRAVAPIQRRVGSFDVETKSYKPPTSNLISKINSTYFVEQPKDVQAKIIAKLFEGKVKPTEVPTSIKAEILPKEQTDQVPPRQTFKSGVVGRIGMKEFFMLSGGTVEVFEGGHLIPHEVWRTGDPKVDLADGYENLVPMSRTLNVGSSEHSWRKIENEILAIYKQGRKLNVKVEIDHEEYTLDYNDVAKLFGLTVAQGKDGSDTITLEGWLPQLITADIDDGNFAFSLQAAENELHDTYTEIKTGADLVNSLQRTPLWLRMSTKLQNKVKKL